MKTALITGATSGIGLATAITLAENGFSLVLCGRNTQKLNELEKELGDLVPVTTLSFDVRDQVAVNKAIASLTNEPFDFIDILINNAGNAHGLDAIDQGSTEDWDAMLDINVKGLLYVSKAIIPQMRDAGRGHIINIGSTAGKEVYPKGNVYCGSKHAVDAITTGMRLDLNPYGIRVGAVNPGLVETNFSKVRFKGDTNRADQVYKGYMPLQPEDVADAILFAITRPPHVNIADLTMMCTAQASSTIVKKEI
ncbi:oxidoreductase [Nonlabens tegetincola]|uniref:Oxidoreductase n=1 Tax=Nonlabens tegetincola TaxID=323273 RepID=A0A090PYA8_9FLAO|nr:MULTISPECIES: SDR family NAD(P)-dependent oxidoreductase [Nonlabens]MEE2800973.1 SDR family NAD(P)-dependent oxidoreductase [Bacteroidota bacterium]ALM21025.1 malonic semialdehyde reductase [Nonlabens sp. MIC269]ARN72258.1 NAD(P)-dependent oxidoreductase [Nonlabens tegetincola]PQJ20125.1 NAD(P)-dependent oxidoreductase [Nonlabens tegetincola]GAK95839.1 oxidoreductase [Nonlabens tegetincola]